MIEPELRHAITTAIEREGAHLIELIARGDRSRRVLEVFVDAETGITTEICATISRSIAAAIEESGLIPGSYRLDVSSPGIDRPLAFPWQYAKHLGRTLRVTAAPIAVATAAMRPEGREAGRGPESVQGVLKEVGEEGITLIPAAGEPLHIAFSGITEARVVAPW